MNRWWTSLNFHLYIVFKEIRIQDNCSNFNCNHSNSAKKKDISIMVKDVDVCSGHELKNLT